jgi:hypothetical protein
VYWITVTILILGYFLICSAKSRTAIGTANAEVNFIGISEILKCPVQRGGILFPSYSCAGIYKGRIVRCKAFFYSTREGSGMTISIRPWLSWKFTDFFSFKRILVSPNTYYYFSSNLINYNSSPGNSDFLEINLAPQDIINVLEELTKSAEIIEAKFPQRVIPG